MMVLFTTPVSNEHLYIRLRSRLKKNFVIQDYNQRTIPKALNSWISSLNKDTHIDTDPLVFHSGQTHVKLKWPSTQVAPPSHGLLAQSFPSKTLKVNAIKKLIQVATPSNGHRFSVYQTL